MRRIALRLGLAQAASGLIGGAYTPFFGAWLAYRGVSASGIGIILAAGMLLRIVVVPFCGIVADARNDRRAMMLILYAVMFAGYAALNWSVGLLVLILAAVAAAVAGGAITPLLESVSVRLSERYAFDYGHVRLWASTLFVAGNLVSGRINTVYGLGFLPVWLTVVLALNIAAIYALPAAPRPQHGTLLVQRMRATFAEARELLRSKVFVTFLIAASLDQGSHALYYGYGGLHWLKLGYGGTLVGIIWPLGIAGEILLMSRSLAVFRRLGATRLLLLGGVGCVLRWSLLAFDPPLPLVVFAQFLHGATFALAHLGAMYFILKSAPPRLAATAQSLYAVCSSGFAMGLATLASGPLYGAYGGRAYLLMAAMGAASVLFSWRLGHSWHGGRITAQCDEEAIDTI